MISKVKITNVSDMNICSLEYLTETKTTLDYQISALCEFLNDKDNINKIPYYRLQLMQERRDILLDLSDKLNREILVFSYKKEDYTDGSI